MAARAPLVSVVLRVPGLPGPLEVLRRLVDRPRPFLRFAAAGPRDLATWSFAGSDPVETLDAATAGPGRADPLAALARRWPRPVRRLGPRIPFAGGWVATLGYEVRSAVESTPPPRRPPSASPPCPRRGTTPSSPGITTRAAPTSPVRARPPPPPARRRAACSGA